ncbi:hypothetical protein DSO57_1011493 [Entomophthora muscae]|uniref:Uncharacterized protein n=1 Tax=Entomophthora muscae TaxID=34485 RepID=A0ACC2TUS3_9FUNG|nr:hypothetical protein DSO57_1011493 [Entomophthora muscae]
MAIWISARHLCKRSGESRSPEFLILVSILKNMIELKGENAILNLLSTQGNP